MILANSQKENFLKDYFKYMGQFLRSFFMYKIKSQSINLDTSPNKLLKVFSLIKRFGKDLFEMFFIPDFEKRGCKSNTYSWIKGLRKENHSQFCKYIQSMRSWLSQISIKNFIDFIGRDRLQPHKNQLQTFLRDQYKLGLIFQNIDEIFPHNSEFQSKRCNWGELNQHPLLIFKFTIKYINTVLIDKKYQPIRYDHKTGNITFAVRSRDDIQVKGRQNETSMLGLYRYNLSKKLSKNGLPNRNGSIMTLHNCDTIGDMIFSGIEDDESLLFFLFVKNINYVKRNGQQNWIYKRFQETYFDKNNIHYDQIKISWASQQNHWRSIAQQNQPSNSMKIGFLSINRTLIKDHKEQLKQVLNKKQFQKFDPTIFKDYFPSISNVQLQTKPIEWQVIEDQVNTMLDARQVAKDAINQKKPKTIKRKGRKQRRMEEQAEQEEHVEQHPQIEPSIETLEPVLHCWGEAEKCYDKENNIKNFPQLLKKLDKINLVEYLIINRIPAIISEQNGEWKPCKLFKLDQQSHQIEQNQDPFSNQHLLSIFGQSQNLPNPSQIQEQQVIDQRVKQEQDIFIETNSSIDQFPKSSDLSDLYDEIIKEGDLYGQSGEINSDQQKQLSKLKLDSDLISTKAETDFQPDVPQIQNFVQEKDLKMDAQYENNQSDEDNFKYNKKEQESAEQNIFSQHKQQVIGDLDLKELERQKCADQEDQKMETFSSQEEKFRRYYDQKWLKRNRSDSIDQLPLFSNLTDPLEPEVNYFKGAFSYWEISYLTCQNDDYGIDMIQGTKRIKQQEETDKISYQDFIETLNNDQLGRLLNLS